MAFKSLLKLCSWDAIKAAFSCRRASRSAFSLSLSRGVGFPVVMEDVSFQSPAFARVGVLDGEVFLARTRDGEADIGQASQPRRVHRVASGCSTGGRCAAPGRM
jgi:hypothetical protein